MVQNDVSVCKDTGWPEIHVQPVSVGWWRLALGPGTAILLSGTRHHYALITPPIVPIKPANRIFNSRQTLCANKTQQTHVIHFANKNHFVEIKPAYWPIDYKSSPTATHPPTQQSIKQLHQCYLTITWWWLQWLQSYCIGFLDTDDSATFRYF